MDWGRVGERVTQAVGRTATETAEDWGAAYSEHRRQKVRKPVMDSVTKAQLLYASGKYDEGDMELRPFWNEQGKLPAGLEDSDRQLLASTREYGRQARRQAQQDIEAGNRRQLEEKHEKIKLNLTVDKAETDAQDRRRQREREDKQDEALERDRAARLQVDRDRLKLQGQPLDKVKDAALTWARGQIQDWKYNDTPEDQQRKSEDILRWAHYYMDNYHKLGMPRPKEAAGGGGKGDITVGWPEAQGREAESPFAGRRPQPTGTTFAPSAAPAGTRPTGAPVGAGAGAAGTPAGGGMPGTTAIISLARVQQAMTRYTEPTERKASLQRALTASDLSPEARAWLEGELAKLP